MQNYDYMGVMAMLTAPQVPTPRPKIISEPSLKSLFIEMLFGALVLASGTGFVCMSKLGPVLVTNRHNVTGRNQDTGECLDTKYLSIPDRIRVTHNHTGDLGRMTTVVEPLYFDDGEPRWREHPRFFAAADLVALPLTKLTNVKLYPYALDDPIDMRVQVSDQVSVVGFPFGLKAESTAVWATGFVASEPEIDFDRKPMFLIDCRTRKGQSGSAVIAHRNDGSFTDSRGTIHMAGGVITKFLGIYCGRINEESDLGMVWKASAVNELVDAI